MEIARTCGDCGLCCKIMGVEAIAKPPRKWCGHYSRSAGCRIYADRPHACAAFNCIWLLATNLGEEWKPTQAGFVMHSEEGGRRLVVEGDPSRPHDWRRAPYEAVLRRWAGEMEVLVFAGPRGVRLGADGRDEAVVRV